MERERPFVTLHSGVSTKTELVALSDKHHWNYHERTISVNTYVYVCTRNPEKYHNSASLDIFGEGRKPTRMRIDTESKFVNKEVVRILKKESVSHFVTHNTVKVSYAESAINATKMRLHVLPLGKDISFSKKLQTIPNFVV